MTSPEEHPPLSTVVVVGTSLAGLRACESLRQRGFSGRIVAIDAEKDPFVDRPPLSKQFLAGTWGFDRIALRPPEKVAALELELRNGRAAGLDLKGREVELEDGTRIGFDGLVIATGAVARTFPGASGLGNVLTLRSLADAVSLRDAIVGEARRLVVVGGGFLGMEVAATARSLGASAAVVEPFPAPLSRVLGDRIGEVVARLHRDHGVELHLGVGVAGFTGTSQVEAVRLDDGSELVCDVALVAIGAAPETGWLEGSGLELADGIVADSSLVVGPGIVAAGDCVRWPHPLASGLVRIEHWTNAAEQGAHAALSLLSAPRDRTAFTSVPYFWSDQYDIRIQALGLPRPGDDVEVVRGSLEEGRFVTCHGRSGRFVGAVGFGRPRDLMAYRALLDHETPFGEALAFGTGA